ncbi:MAG: response regulator [Blastocatellia bacterium]
MNKEIVKVLLIEDDEDDYLITRELLSEIKGTKFLLDWVMTYKTAQEAISQNNHDIYLVDYRLGESNGLDLIKEYISKEEYLSPFILLTGQNEYEIDVDAMKIGASDYLIKNELTAHILERAIRYALERARRLLALKQRDKQIQDQSRILESILHCIADGVLVADTNGKFLLFNPAAEYLIGKDFSPAKTEEWTGHFGCFLADKITPYPSNELPLVKAIRGESVDNVEVFICNPLKPDGVLLNVTARPLKGPSGILLGGVAVFHDITEYKKTQEELLQERAMLTRRVEERTADLQLTNIELARTSQMKDEFLASMSHELRTPLNAIIGLSEALMEGVYGGLNEDQISNLQIIEESGQHLLSLINDILDLSKIEAGKLELFFDWVIVESICQASLAFIKQIASKKSQKVSFMMDSQVDKIWVDARRLKQILVNLLSNAVKFTPEGGSIGLEVIGDPKEHIIKFVVWDTGIGIKESEWERIFQPFVQIDSALSRKNYGTGLGLTLISKMVDLSEGSISVESQEGTGSKFTILLPWHQQESLLNQTFTNNKLEQREYLKSIKKVLIVEDSPSTAEQLARYLKEFGIESFIYINENGLFEKILEIQPDIILLDILLPNTSGWQILEKVKANISTKQIPVLIISVIDDRKRAEQAGASGYIVKPVTRENLEQAIVKTFSSSNLSENKSFKTTDNVKNIENDQRPVILLAEDNENNIKTFSDYLNVKGYNVVVAHNGIEAIVQVKKNKPNLILMDIQMPNMDGLEAIRFIRADKELVNIPIIALTALAMPNDRNICLQAGANEYLSKPISLRKLAEVIEIYLKKSS